MGVLALGSITVLGLPCGKIGGGGGANVGAGSSGGGGGGGGGVKTGGKVEVKEEGAGKDGDSAHLSTSEAAFLNFSSSTAASDLVCRKQRSETMSTVVNKRTNVQMNSWLNKVHHPKYSVTILLHFILLYSYYIILL